MKTTELKEEKELCCWNNHPRDGFKEWFEKFENKEAMVIVFFENSESEELSLQQVAYYCYQDIPISNDTSVHDLTVYVNKLLECNNLDSLFFVTNQEDYPATRIFNLEYISKN